MGVRQMMAYQPQNRSVARDELSEQTKNGILSLWTVKSFYRRSGFLAPALLWPPNATLGHTGAWTTGQINEWHYISKLNWP